MSSSLPPTSNLPRSFLGFSSSMRRLWPGVALSALVAMAATFVSEVHGGPQLLYALFFGIAMHHLSADSRSRPGVEFCARTVLRLGVGLLGARITADQIAALGWQSAAMVVLGVISTMVLGWLLGCRIGLTRAQSVLSGGSVAICGASAALAISAVLPRDKESERFTLMVVVSVTVLSTIAMVLYPLLARSLHLPSEFAGIFLGGTIHDVAQVVGAGYMLDQQTGDTATVVKLFRVSLLVLVVIAVSAAFRKEREAGEPASDDHDSGPQRLIPWFLWLFIAMVLTNSAGLFPTVVKEGLNTVSRVCLVMAIAALGVKTSFAALAQAGWRPMILIMVETLWLATVVLASVLLFL